MRFKIKKLKKDSMLTLQSTLVMQGILWACAGFKLNTWASPLIDAIGYIGTASLIVWFVCYVICLFKKNKPSKNWYPYDNDNY